MGGQQETPPSRMVVLTISVALLLIFASPGSCQNLTFEYSSNQTAGSGSGDWGYGSNYSGMGSGEYGSGSGSGEWEYGSNHSGMGSVLWEYHSYSSNHSGMGSGEWEYGSNHSGMGSVLFEYHSYGSNHSGMGSGEWGYGYGWGYGNGIWEWGYGSGTTAWTIASTTPRTQGTFGSTASGLGGSPSSATMPQSPHQLGITIQLEPQ